jgi:hypothetical protein
VEDRVREDNLRPTIGKVMTNVENKILKTYKH